MRFIIGFLVGALVGAATALMFAPSSGDEMRANIKSQVDAQAARAQEQWQLRYNQMQANIDKLNSDLQALRNKQAVEIEPTDN